MIRLACSEFGIKRNPTKRNISQTTDESETDIYILLYLSLQSGPLLSSLTKNRMVSVYGIQVSILHAKFEQIKCSMSAVYTALDLETAFDPITGPPQFV